MDPLSIAASIAGLLALTSRVASVLSTVVSAHTTLPAYFKDVQSEVMIIELALLSLNKLVTGEVAIRRPRATLIKLYDLGTVVTDCVMTLSELDKHLRPFSTYWAFVSTIMRNPKFNDELLKRLQRHKVSLNLILNIIQWCVAVLILTTGF